MTATETLASAHNMPVTYMVLLDRLDADFAIFGAPTGARAVIPRDVWEAQERPREVEVVVRWGLPQ